MSVDQALTTALRLVVPITAQEQVPLAQASLFAHRLQTGTNRQITCLSAGFFPGNGYFGLFAVFAGAPVLLTAIQSPSAITAQISVRFYD